MADAQAKPWVVVVRFADGGVAVHGPFPGLDAAEGSRRDVIAMHRDGPRPRLMDGVTCEPVRPV